MTGRITCVVADDHPPIVDAVSRVLAARGLDVVAQAYDGPEALAKIRATRPQVALVDINLPGMSGLDVAREGSRIVGETHIVLYTGGGDVALVREAIDTGARGFVLKTASLDEVARAIRIVAEGGTYIDAVLAAELTRAAATTTRGLTPRERDVLRLLADGLEYADIAARLYLSPETVRVHVRKAVEKLDANSRTHAVAEAIRQRLIT